MAQGRPHPDLTGRRFTRLQVVERIASKGGRRYACRCDCGMVTPTTAHALVTGKTKSCGCLSRNAFVERNTQHGMTGTREFDAWANMKSRCNNPRQRDYPSYGGRGIAVCERWNNSFANFLADMGKCPPRMTIDRIDNNAGYSPDNCRWADYRTQNRNYRRNRNLTYRGITMPLVDWADALGMWPESLRYRLKRWPLERALGEAKRQWPG